MTYSFSVTIVAASIGLLSGLWLCYPTAASSPHSLAWLANPPFKSADGKIDLAISQSAQYTVGGLLLVFAFLLQVLATLAPQAILQVRYPCQESNVLAAAVLVAITVLVATPISYLIYLLRKITLRRQVTRAIQHLTEHPRLTPVPGK